MYQRRLCTIIAIINSSTLSTPKHVSQRTLATTTIPRRLATASARISPNEFVRIIAYRRSDDDPRRTSSFVLWHAVVATMIPWQRATAAARARNGGWPYTHTLILLFNRNQSKYEPQINLSLILCFFICFHPSGYLCFIFLGFTSSSTCGFKTSIAGFAQREGKSDVKTLP